MTTKKKDRDGCYALQISWRNGTSNMSGAISPERYGAVCQVLNQKQDGDVSVVDTKWLEGVIEDVKQATVLIQTLTQSSMQLIGFAAQCVPALEMWADEGPAPLAGHEMLEVARNLGKIEVGLHPDQPMPVVKPSTPPTKH